MRKQIRIFIVLSAVVVLVMSMSPEFTPEQMDSPASNKIAGNDVLPVKDSVASVKAFAEVYKVLMSPRCMNCHPSGDVPLQGDDSHLHTMGPTRGIDGKGLYAMKCSNCHQPTNTPGLHTPPGNPTWHLPPANMKMIFQGRTAAELAKQLLNRKMNGNKSIDQLIEHASDDLVVWGWEPGEGRTKPPLSYEEFKKAWITWLETGAYAPKK
jgi:hypothetical protein